MTDPDDPLTQIRIDVAEMRGMLTTALQGQTDRLDQLAARDVPTLYSRSNAQGRQLAAHEEKLSDARADVAELQTHSRGALGRVTEVLTPIIAGAALVFTLFGAPPAV